MSGEIFVAVSPLRFAECDPAGIAFYPRLVERVNNCVEDWFAGPVGCSFAEMHLRNGAGAPCRTLEMDFRSPVRLGEPLALRLGVEALGRASIALRIEAAAGGRTIFVARPRLVWCEMEGDRIAPAPIPGDLRARMAAFLAPEAA